MAKKRKGVRYQRKQRMKPKKTALLAAKVPDELAKWYEDYAGMESVSVVVREALLEYRATRMRIAGQAGGEGEEPGPAAQKPSGLVPLPHRKSIAFDPNATEV